MWEPFTERARHAVVRAQEVAQMFASSRIGTEHMAFGLAEQDDDVGRILTTALDGDALRDRLGGASSMPSPEMVFTSGAKRSIELAFENARRLNHSFIDTAHLALGILGADDDLPLRAGADMRAVRAELAQAATADSVAGVRWTQTGGAGDPHDAASALLNVLRYYPDLAPVGTRVSITIARPNGEAVTWSWTSEGDSAG